MLRPTFLAVSLLFFSSNPTDPPTATESQTLQSLLLEIRQLRQEVQTAAFAARKTQILIFRLHQQESVVARASERLEEAKREREQIETQKKYNEVQIKRYQEMLGKVDDAAQGKQFDAAISYLKAQIETFTSQEPEAQTKELELTEQLRIEQAKLDQLQGELERLDKL